MTTWSVDDATRLGRVAYRVPGLGHLLAVPNALAGGALLAGLAVMLVWFVTRPLHARR